MTRRSADRRLEIDRLRPLLGVLLVVAMAATVVSALLGAAYARAAPHQVALDHLDPDRQAALGRRIVAVEAAFDEAAGRAALGVVLGQSTVREGIDVTVLDERAAEASDGPVRWLNLGASGGSFLQLRYYSQPLLDSALRPRLAVLGVHAQWLADPTAQIADQRVRIASHGVVRVFDRLWAWRERNSLRNLASVWLGHARGRALGWAGQPLAVRLPPGRGEGFADDGRAEDPVWSAPRKYVTRHAPAIRQEALRALADAYGWFDDDAFRADGVEATALADLLTRLAERAETIVVVLMPERADLRRAVPERAVRLLESILADAGDGAIHWVDHRAAIDDDALYFDWAHLNADGRRVYSALLARCLSAIATGAAC